MGILDSVGKNITYVDAIESPHAVRFTVSIGAARPLYPTAAGRVLLAYLEPDQLEEYLRTTKLEAQTPRTNTNRTALREELERIRKTRISISLGEMFAESAAIASPVFGADGKIVGAIAIGASVVRLEPRLDELRPLILDVASRASGSARRTIDATMAPEQRPRATTRRRSATV